MHRLTLVESSPQIKLMADGRRAEILRLLMASPATLTQLASRLGQSPAWVRHHLKALEAAGLVVLSAVCKSGKVTERYYRATAGAFLVRHLLLPASDKPPLVFVGSDDLALEFLAERLGRYVHFLYLPVGSLNGLAYLRQGLCQIAGVHICEENGEYNVSTVRHLFPDRPVALITLAYRTQGLMVAPGNPKGLREVADLARPDVRIANRNRGSGTRLWLERELKRQGISPECLCICGHDTSTHTEAALLVASGQADVALGLQAAAYRHGLEFIPLFEERYGVVMLREQEGLLAPFGDALQSVAFREQVRSLAGYDPTHSGEELLLA